MVTGVGVPNRSAVTDVIIGSRGCRSRPMNLSRASACFLQAGRMFTFAKSKSDRGVDTISKGGTSKDTSFYIKILSTVQFYISVLNAAPHLSTVFCFVEDDSYESQSLWARLTEKGQCTLSRTVGLK